MQDAGTAGPVLDCEANRLLTFDPDRARRVERRRNRRDDATRRGC